MKIWVLSDACYDDPDAEPDRYYASEALAVADLKQRHPEYPAEFWREQRLSDGDLRPYVYGNEGRIYRIWNIGVAGVIEDVQVPA